MPDIELDKHSMHSINAAEENYFNKVLKTWIFQSN